MPTMSLADKRPRSGVMALLEVKANIPAREVEGYAATWDVDDVGDQILSGAFSRSLKERFADSLKHRGRADIRVLWQHVDPIGVLLDVKEDENGLWVKVRISRTSLGDDVLQLLADGAIDRMSIGYQVPPGGAIKQNGIRIIRQLDLWEVSFVTFPANPESVVNGVKSSAGQQLELKAHAFSAVAWAQDSEEVKDMSDTVSWETKAGKIQAGRNVERLKSVMDSCKAVMLHCASMLEEAGYGGDIAEKAMTENPDNDHDRDDNAGGRGKPPSNHDVARDARSGKSCPTCGMTHAGNVGSMGQPEPKPDSIAGNVGSLGQPEPKPDSIAGGILPGRGQPEPHSESIAGLIPGFGQPEPKPASIAELLASFGQPEPKPNSIAGNDYPGPFPSPDAESDRLAVMAQKGDVTVNSDLPNEPAELPGETDLEALAEGRRIPGHTWADFIPGQMPTPGNRPGGSGPYPQPTPQPYSVAEYGGDVSVKALERILGQETKESNNSSSYELAQLHAQLKSLADLVEQS